MSDMHKPLWRQEDGKVAIRNIVKMGDDLLRQRSREVTEFDEGLHQLLDDMYETMVKNDGVGIAAPQVGILKRACIVCVDGETVYELINPVIVKASGRQIGREGCLSVPGIGGEVERPKKLIVDCRNRFGEAVRYKVSDFTAVAFSHEMDHLDGILFVDKIIPKEDKR